MLLAKGLHHCFYTKNFKQDSARASRCEPYSNSLCVALIKAICKSNGGQSRDAAILKLCSFAMLFFQGGMDVFVCAVVGLF